MEALKDTGQRGIIDRGWGNLGNCKYFTSVTFCTSLIHIFLMFISVEYLIIKLQIPVFYSVILFINQCHWIPAYIMFIIAFFSSLFSLFALIILVPKNLYVLISEGSRHLTFLALIFSKRHVSCILKVVFWWQTFNDNMG